jgi:hypothetical protein
MIVGCTSNCTKIVVINFKCGKVDCVLINLLMIFDLESTFNKAPFLIYIEYDM